MKMLARRHMHACKTTHNSSIPSDPRVSGQREYEPRFTEHSWEQECSPHAKHLSKNILHWLELTGDVARHTWLDNFDAWINFTIFVSIRLLLWCHQIVNVSRGSEFLESCYIRLLNLIKYFVGLRVLFEILWAARPILAAHEWSLFVMIPMISVPVLYRRGQRQEVIAPA